MSSERHYIYCCRAFGTIFNSKFNFLVFVQRTEVITLNRREVHEHIFTAIFRSNKAKAFICIKPFHQTGHFSRHLSFLIIYIARRH